jgi:hypothetical protein|tara:strand:+ start:2001 stop:2216 length:216 start_codon:yes stop_codon:yes gene_type:complete
MKLSRRKAQVLKVLQNAEGDWVGGPALCNQAVGGSEGLRRLRELRALGYNIEKIKFPKQNYFSYRLAGWNV